MALSSNLRKAVSDAKNKYGRSDGKRIKPKEGRNVYRIIAPSKAAWLGAGGEFWADLGVHWIKPTANGKPIAVVGSRDVCFQQPCSVGTAIELALARADTVGFDDETKKVLLEMKVSKSVLFNAIERTVDADAQEIEILELRPSAAQQILDLYLQYDEAGQDLFALENGMDIVVTRSGKGLSTEYTVNIKPGASKAVKLDAFDRCINLGEHIEKEFFRGDEQKALNAIAQISGVSVPSIAAPVGGLDNLGQVAAARTATAALQSPGASVSDAHVTKAAPATVEVDADVLSAEELEMIELEQKMAAAKKAKAQREAAAEAAVAAIAAIANEPDSAATGLSDAEVDDVLSQLNTI